MQRVEKSLVPLLPRIGDDFAVAVLNASAHWDREAKAAAALMRQARQVADPRPFLGSAVQKLIDLNDQVYTTITMASVGAEPLDRWWGAMIMGALNMTQKQAKALLTLDEDKQVVLQSSSRMKIEEACRILLQKPSGLEPH